ncbi:MULTISPECIES: efflux RND transporter periplasmic adaptor subunit [unclassified Janthinobacterium]|uniref:efflux RND transporter periplasmic adaptor subunit n=1 Tax=unclassified Janthinobacterium TaxID=2610881 RepID=UPI00034CE489|nr:MULTISPECIES: efflux RND transporter periplasmic adaptor subunit [unclassified Janthinobacterium]MEC5159082.1 multidrug efflux system membrane fusion protein [Janthinobacterium sp. CG_S6]
MKKSTVGLLVGVAVCIGAGAWYATRQGGAPAPGQAGAGQPPTVVTVTTPRRQDVPVLLQANGNVTPISSVELHPQITSTIAAVHIREGQFVKAGELMFTLDARNQQAAVDKARAQVARDRAGLADAERQYQRSLELLGKNFIAQSAADTLKSQLDSARALLGADQAALRAAQVDAGYAGIRAPMAGRVGAIGVYPGSLVQLASVLTSITQLNPINVSFTLPESALAALLAAHKAGAVPVAAGVGGRQVQGALSFIDSSVDPVAGVIRLKAQFDNRDTQLWPGQYVAASLTVQTLKDALVIPQNAIISNSTGVFVYTMEADRTAKVRPVARLHSFGLNAAVSGLNGDEKVIVDGKQNLRPGGKVRLADQAGNGAPAGKGQGGAHGKKGQAG